MHRSSQAGFTLVEIATVIALIGVLATQASFTATVQQKRAKRTEVTLGLAALEQAQHVHLIEYGRYAATFQELAFDVDGGYIVSPTVMKARRYTYVLSQPWGARSYYVVATGQIDNDAFPDVHVLEAGRP